MLLKKFPQYIIISLSLIVSTSMFAQYCIPDFEIGTSTGTALNRFVLEGIDNTSGAGADWNDYTAISTVLSAATNYTITIYNYDNGCFYAVWIDYNHDEEFTSDEKLAEELGVFGTGPDEIDFTTPANVTPGPTRLRVLCSSSMGWELYPCEDPDYYYGESEDYTVIFLSDAENDAGVYEVLAPVSDCEISGPNEVTVVIKNYGDNDVSSGDFTVSYQLTDPVDGILPVVTESYNGPTLSTFEATEFTFATDAVISNSGDFEIESWINWEDDEEELNDGAFGEFSNYVLVEDYPYSEDFESGSGGWYQDGENSSWELGFPNGSVINIPPPATPESFASWTTMLEGTYNEDEDSWLNSPCFDFSELILPYIEFDIWWDTYFQWDGCHVLYSIDGGTNWEILGDVGTGDNWYTYEYIFAFPALPGWEGEGGGWYTAHHELAFLAGEPSVKFRFNFQSTNNSFDFGDGIAVDNFLISDALADDVGVTALISPVSAALEIPDMAEVVVSITNFGIEAQSGFDVSYSVNNGPVSTFTFTGTLEPGQTSSINLAEYDFSADGDYEFVSWTSLVGDENIGNDTLYTTVVNFPPQMGSGAYLIYSNTTGTEPFYGTEYEDDMNLVFGDFWQLDYFEELDPLEVFSENTCFVYLAGGFTQANELEAFLDANLLIIEPWVESGGHLIINVSPAEGDGMNLGFDGTTLVYPHYTYNGNSVDMSHPVFSGYYSPTQSNYTGDFIARARIEGDMITIFEDTQDPGKILLGEKLWGNGKVMFASLDKYTEWYANPEAWNMHLNMLNYMKVCGVVDVGALSLVYPVSGCGISDEQLITVAVNNYGLTDAYNIPIFYAVNGGDPAFGNVPFVPAGSSVEFTFPVTADMQAAGDYTIEIWTQYFGDADELNDDVSFVITSLATPLIELGPDVIVCDEYVLDAGNEGSLYLWNTEESTQEITVTTTGTYVVTIINPLTECMTTDSLYVTIENFPVAGFEYSADGEVVTFTNTSDGGTSYSWNLGDGFGSTESDPVHDYGEGGTYVVTFYVTNTCGTDTFSDTLEVEDVPDFILNADGLDDELQVYPNPSDGMVKLQFENPDRSHLMIFLCNQSGQIVWTFLGNGETIGSTELDFTALSAGVYYFSVVAEGKTIQKKWIKLE